jgi:hypothetical protein
VHPMPRQLLLIMVDFLESVAYCGKQNNKKKLSNQQISETKKNEA